MRQLKNTVGAPFASSSCILTNLRTSWSFLRSVTIHPTETLQTHRPWEHPNPIKHQPTHLVWTSENWLSFENFIVPLSPRSLNCSPTITEEFALRATKSQLALWNPEDHYMMLACSKIRIESFPLGAWLVIITDARWIFSGMAVFLSFKAPLSRTYVRTHICSWA